jgi:hypothetical protein
MKGTIPRAFSRRTRFSKEKHLEKSALPTMHFQNSLPKLGIPELKKTEMRVVNAVEALAGHPNFTQTSIEDFKLKWADYVKTGFEK